MATKIEQWKDNEHCVHDTELEALYADVADAWAELEPDEDDNISGSSPRLLAAADALHEYVHRRDVTPPAPETVTDGPLFRHCGSEPGDTWVERLERVNQQLDETGHALVMTQDALDSAIQAAQPPSRPTLDEVKALRKGDEVMISGSWFRVSRRHVCNTGAAIVMKEHDYVPISFDELATICQGIRRGK